MPSFGSSLFRSTWSRGSSRGPFMGRRALLRRTSLGAGLLRSKDGAWNVGTCLSWPDHPGYSHVAVARGTTMVFTAGAVPLERAASWSESTTPSTQTDQVVTNLIAALDAAGARPDDVVKTTVYVAGADYDRQATAWEAVSASPRGGAEHAGGCPDPGIPRGARGDRGRRGHRRLSALSASTSPGPAGAGTAAGRPGCSRTAGRPDGARSRARRP